MSTSENVPPPNTQGVEPPEIIVPHSQGFTLQNGGFLPPVDTLKEYEKLTPGITDRLLVMAEKNADARRAWEQNALRLASEEVFRGQRFGFILGLGALIVAATALFLGFPNVASAVIAAMVAGLGVGFITGRKK